MSYAEYKASIGPQNRQYHEIAEMIVLARQGVLPLDDDEQQHGDRTQQQPSTQPTVRGKRLN